MIENLEAALIAAFPPVAIDRAMIDEPSARWDPYPRYDDLVEFEGKTWRELTRDIVFAHEALPVYAGDQLWRTVLPAYLWYLLHERREFNMLPFQLASQLSRKEDPDSRAHLDRRIEALSREQRVAIRNTLAFLATITPMEECMSRAMATWNDLTREG